MAKVSTDRLTKGAGVSKNKRTKMSVSKTENTEKTQKSRPRLSGKVSTDRLTEGASVSRKVKN